MNTRSSKYEPLYKFLKLKDTNRVVMTFSDLEDVLGFTLPPTALRQDQWWVNNNSQHTQANSWLNAGFRAVPKLNEKKVEFVKYLEE